MESGDPLTFGTFQRAKTKTKTIRTALLPPPPRGETRLQWTARPSCFAPFAALRWYLVSGWVQASNGKICSWPDSTFPGAVGRLRHFMDPTGSCSFLVNSYLNRFGLNIFPAGRRRWWSPPLWGLLAFLHATTLQERVSLSVERHYVPDLSWVGRRADWFLAAGRRFTSQADLKNESKSTKIIYIKNNFLFQRWTCFQHNSLLCSLPFAWTHLTFSSRPQCPSV